MGICAAIKLILEGSILSGGRRLKIHPITMLERKIKELLKDVDVDGHGLTHALRVRKLARKLAEDEEIDVEVVEAAALLHDLARALRLEGDHAEVSAELAHQLLEEVGFPEAKMNKVIEAIKGHRYTANMAPRSPEAAVLKDADMLDALGAIGVLRAIAFGATRGRSLYHFEDPFAEKRELDDDKYTLDHFYTKLLKLKKAMKTKRGRKEAERRTRFLKAFLKELKTEIED